MAVAPPRPTRRIVLAFDPRNSRFPIREEWREAAMDWVRESMKPEDVVSMVVLRSYPDWVVPPTSDRQRLLEGLEIIDLYTDIPNRNRRDEMTSFLDDLRTLCVESGPVAGLSPRGFYYRKSYLIRFGDMYGTCPRIV